ncbi:hypothetical protein ACLOJK_034196, partial [Asimina triloba]
MNGCWRRADLPVEDEDGRRLPCPDLPWMEDDAALDRRWCSLADEDLPDFAMLGLHTRSAIAGRWRFGDAFAGRSLDRGPMTEVADGCWISPSSTPARLLLVERDLLPWTT